MARQSVLGIAQVVLSPLRVLGVHPLSGSSCFAGPPPHGLRVPCQWVIVHLTTHAGSDGADYGYLRPQKSRLLLLV
jgi:hypothetical protein